MNTFQTVLLAFGGNAILLAVLGWLAKSLVEKFIARDVERFKNTLMIETSSAVETLKHQLQIASVEHQIRFSELHAKRAAVIAELYGLLVEAQWAASSFASPIELGAEPKKSEKYISAMNAGAEFYRFFDKNRIYLPAELCDRLESFFDTMRGKVIGFGAYVHYEDEHLPAHGIQEKHNSWTEAWKFFREKLPKARTDLEEELRTILGYVPASSKFGSSSKPKPLRGAD